MALRRSVPNLHNLATNEVLQSILNYVALKEDQIVDDDQDTQVVRYLKSMPEVLCEDILLHILSKDGYFSCGVRLELLKLLLFSSTQRLVIGIFPDIFHSKILDIISNQGKGITNLDLRGLWVKDIYAQKLCAILMQLSSLVVLRIPHMANDEILRTIGQCNRSLSLLDISGECSLTEAGIRSLCMGNNCDLQLVNVGRPGDCTYMEPKTIALLISNLPKLTSLGCYSFVGQSLTCLDKGDTFQTKLGYIHDTCTDLGTMQVIVHICPTVKFIHLDKPRSDALHNLWRIKSLRELKLSRFQCHDFKDVIVACGNALVNLNLVIGCGILDGSSIAEFCPQLTTLTCYKIDHMVYFKEAPFLCLEKLSIFYSTLSTSCLRYFLNSSSHLERVCLHNNFMNVSDWVIAEIFYKPSYVKIRELRISNARLLTMNGLNVILRKCPNLEVLGYLGTWGLTSEEIDEFQVHVYTSNFNLLVDV